MKLIIAILLFSSFTLPCFCQTANKKNVVYLEVGGNGLFGSINYERQLSNEPGLGLRLGVGFYTEKAFYLTVPVGINYLFELKENKSFIDAGLGVTWTSSNGNLFGNTNNNEDFVNFIPSIGYRYHTRKNVMWKISITPVANKYTFVPWLGIGVGKRF